MATVSTSLNIQTEGVYTVELNVLPDGATVTPVNDIQTWLHCANIWDKNYTTLDEVLADNSTLLALISDHNAVDYMVRSTEWSGNGQALVPTMTSNTTPSGIASASSEPWTNQGYYAYKAFMDGTGIRDFWIGNKAGAYLQYEFPSAVLATIAFVKNCNGGGSNPYYMQGFTIQGSNDGNTFYELVTSTISQAANSEKTVKFTNNVGTYKYYRLIPDMGSMAYASVGKFQLYAARGICSNQTAMSYIGNNDYCAETLLADATWLEAIVNSEYVESVLTTKVPTMTSATTPSGECIESGHYSNNVAFRAFDGMDNTTWEATEYATNAWVGYKFTSNVCVCAIRLKHYRISTFKIEGSNDGTNWTDISTTFSTIGDDNMYAFINATKYQYHRLHYLSTTSAEGYVYTLQFYGRA